jgi:flagellar hook protein FlgE
LLAPAASGSRGAIVSGALEGSNVDLGQELVTLIQYQRAFQANARTVTTADEMLSELANLKR